MLDAARKIASLFFIDQELSDLRASFIEYGLTRGSLPSSDKWETLEAEIVAEANRLYPPGEETSPDPDATEAALWFSHRLLKTLPFHGHPDYQEP